jgi:hypothetical protein
MIQRWWWKQKRLIIALFWHRWSPEKISLHLVAVKASNLTGKDQIGEACTTHGWNWGQEAPREAMTAVAGYILKKWVLKACYSLNSTGQGYGKTAWICERAALLYATTMHMKPVHQICVTCPPSVDTKELRSEQTVPIQRREQNDNRS